MKVLLSKKADGNLKSLPKIEQKKITKKLLLLVDSPFSGKKLTGEYSEIWSLKVWPYRIIYRIDKMRKEVLIGAILHRQGAYK